MPSWHGPPVYASEFTLTKDILPPGQLMRSTEYPGTSPFEIGGSNGREGATTTLLLINSG